MSRRRPTASAACALAPVLWGVLALATAPTATAQVAASEQVETFTRIFAFDRALAGEKITVLLVADETTSGATGLRGAFEAAGMVTRSTTPEELAAQLAGVSVVYFATDSVSADAQRQVAAAGALSIAGDPELAENGRVSVALDPRGARTGIVVNASRLAAERHTLSPQLLKQPWVTVVHDAATAGTRSAAPSACQVARADPPSYPSAALRMKIQGTVRLRVLVGADLAAERVEVVESVDFLDAAAERAAMRSRYASPGWCLLAVPFRIE